MRVGRQGHRTHALRLWTSLMNPRTAPAVELARLYAQRWEQELYFRELKRHVRKTDVLQSHTVETAAQEIAALVLVSALLATKRAQAAVGHVPVLRISFLNVLEWVKPMWLALQVGDGLLTDQQKDQMMQRTCTLMGQWVTPARRSRSCPRAVRQPVTGWPRLLRTQSIEGPLHFQVL